MPAIFRPSFLGPTSALLELHWKEPGKDGACTVEVELLEKPSIARAAATPIAAASTKRDRMFAG